MGVGWWLDLRVEVKGVRKVSSELWRGNRLEVFCLRVSPTRVLSLNTNCFHLKKDFTQKSLVIALLEIDSSFFRHSHINALTDFQNPADLAHYLHSLIDDPQKYAEYFWWKPFYYSNRQNDFNHPAWCELCRQMHENSETKIYNDLDKWWVQESNCSRYTFRQPTEPIQTNP